MLLLTAPQKC